MLSNAYYYMFLYAHFSGSAGRSIPADDTVELELNQLRQERELLREEVAQVSVRLKACRDELQETEHRLESGREQASQSLRLLQDSLQEERKKRQAAEEDCRTHAEVCDTIWGDPSLRTHKPQTRNLRNSLQNSEKMQLQKHDISTSYRLWVAVNMLNE